MSGVLEIEWCMFAPQGSRVRKGEKMRSGDKNNLNLLLGREVVWEINSRVDTARMD
jgi:hypothetical protein